MATIPPPAATVATDALHERMIDSEYKIWKKNTPFLYDFVLTHSLEWPSLTVEWLPVVTATNNHSELHQLLIGTHTAGEQNYLMVATAVVPKDDDDTTEEQLQQQISTSNARYDDEKKEVGGYGLNGSRVGKVDIKMKIKHEGEVHRARYMPQNHFIVASRGPSPELYIWDFSKHPSIPDEQSAFCPQGVCQGHTKDGYAMAWSPHEEGKLASGSEDASVLLWDVRAGYQTKGPGTQIGPTRSYTPNPTNGHSETIEDVAWHPKDAHVIGSVSDDKSLCVWDLRAGTAPMKRVAAAHTSDVNCLAFNPVSEFMIATGGADSIVNIWDMRNLQKPLAKLEGHTDQVFKVEWAPFNESILGSCSSDRRVALWDLSRIGQEQTPEDAQDGPPELLFLHGGHTAKVSDFAWNSTMDWCISSVSEDNVLQIWTPVEEIYVEADDDEEEEEEEEEETKATLAE